MLVYQYHNYKAEELCSHNIKRLPARACGAQVFLQALLRWAC